MSPASAESRAISGPSRESAGGSSAAPPRSVRYPPRQASGRTSSPTPAARASSISAPARARSSSTSRPKAAQAAAIRRVVMGLSFQPARPEPRKAPDASASELVGGVDDRALAGVVDDRVLDVERVGRNDPLDQVLFAGAVQREPEAAAVD